MSRPYRIILAVLCALVGVAGVFLPILQAWFFFGLSLILLSPEFPFVKKWIAKIEARFPRLGRKLREFERKVAGEKGEPAESS